MEWFHNVKKYVFMLKDEIIKLRESIVGITKFFTKK